MVFSAVGAARAEPNRRREGIPTEQVDVVEYQGRQAGKVLRLYRVTLSSKLLERDSGQLQRPHRNHLSALSDGDLNKLDCGYLNPNCVLC
jgi:hypothetical protein